MSVNQNTTHSPTASHHTEDMGSPLSSTLEDSSSSSDTTMLTQNATTTTVNKPDPGNNSTSITVPSLPVAGSNQSNPPTFPDDMDVDMDHLTFPSTVTQFASANDVSHLRELQATAYELTKEIAIASAKLPSLHGDARRVAMQEIQDLALTIKATNELLASFATPSAKISSSVNKPAICPKNLPYFQWEGAVFNESSTIFVDVDACLTQFQDVMNLHALNFDTEFLRLVPPMLSPTQRTWYQSFLLAHATPTWEELKSAFTARYGISVLDDRQKSAADLMNISFRPNEHLDTFVDRFNDLRRRAFDQVPQSFLLVSRLMLILPSPLRSQVNIVRQSKGLDNNNTTVDTIITIAKDFLLANMTSSEVATAMGFTTPTAPQGAQASKWASTNGTSVSHALPVHNTNSIPVYHANSSRITKPIPRSGKYCSFHKSKTHNTNECNAFATALAASTSSTSSSTGSTSAPFIRDCGAPNYVEGHICATATRTGNPPSAPEHRFRMLQINDTKAPPSSTLATGNNVQHVMKYCTFHKSKKTQH
ncbi:hypothetical protein HMPREF1544_12355 [Mucor circinelloides 1006PhL]|uniref:Retrotransposon gag domain-containing protein n=1 Tax=Mucor circinelloides f. circinelloides (strain 1006PhL) TaxID=1220926 RepID=S2JEM8_MUCC1|nr:hypothetical protein HMPREF1544_12355 [Mucor circinelloides 1006PhL]